MTTPKPLCKVCGKPIPKQMTHHSFGAQAYQLERQHEFWRFYAEKPATREEAQRLVGNRPIVTLNQYHEGTIGSCTTWDGESYVWGGHFHAQGCAAQFGLSMAGLFPDYSMPAFKEAAAAQQAKAKA